MFPESLDPTKNSDKGFASLFTWKSHLPFDIPCTEKDCKNLQKIDNSQNIIWVTSKMLHYLNNTSNERIDNKLSTDHQTDLWPLQQRGQLTLWKWPKFKNISESKGLFQTMHWPLVTGCQRSVWWIYKPYSPTFHLIYYSSNLTFGKSLKLSASCHFFCTFSSLFTVSSIPCTENDCKNLQKIENSKNMISVTSKMLHYLNNTSNEWIDNKLSTDNNTDLWPLQQRGQQTLWNLQKFKNISESNGLFPAKILVFKTGQSMLA